MNIAFLMKSFSRDEKDAAVTTELNLASELEKKGHNVAIITDRGRKSYEGYERTPEYEKINDVPIYRPYYMPWIRTYGGWWHLDFSLIFNRFLAPALGLKYVEKNLNKKFDIIRTSAGAFPFILMGYLAKLLSKNKNIKFVHAIKSYSLIDKFWFSPGSLCWARLLNLADMIIIPSKIMAEKFIKNGLNKEKITIIHSGINTEKFIPRNKEVLKKKYGFANKKIILYYGHWGKQKGVHNLIEISPEIVDEIEDIEILLIHPSDISEPDIKLLNRYKEKGNLTFINRKVKIEDYVAMADIVVLPYITMKGTETNPLCLLESMASKTPVITTDFPELRELVVPGKDVLMAKPNNKESLFKNIIKLLNDKELQKNLAENAYKKSKQFDIKKIVQQNIKLYEKLIRK